MVSILSTKCELPLLSVSPESTTLEATASFSTVIKQKSVPSKSRAAMFLKGSPLANTQGMFFQVILTE